jgi:hypothetical protein
LDSKVHSDKFKNVDGPGKGGIPIVKSVSNYDVGFVSWMIWIPKYIVGSFITHGCQRGAWKCTPVRSSNSAAANIHYGKACTKGKVGVTLSRAIKNFKLWVG